MNKILLLLLICVLLNLTPSLGFFGFGNKKKKEEEAKKAIEMKQNIYSGMESLRELGSDPQAMKETMELLNDPETMKEVEAMMKDPAFIKEMEMLKKDPLFAKTLNSANAMYNDPQKAKEVMDQVKTKSDAELGLQELSKAASNPKLLAEAMEMLKDPEIAAQVKEMMNDPKFKADMAAITNTPNFKAAMEKASDDIESLSKDPVLMNKMKAKLNAEL